jgi:leader peptidase (prepilin peptidase) / N-methyltransferase
MTARAGGATPLPLDVPERWGRAWRSRATTTAMAVLAAVTLARFGATPQGFTLAFFVAVLVALAVIDVQRRILPNAIVLPSAALVLAAQLAFYPEHAWAWILAAAGAASLLFVLYLVNPAGMGMGDVKLALLLGAGLGGSVIWALLLAWVSVLPVVLYLLVRNGMSARKKTIAFGPFLAFGAIVAALLGSPAV